MKAIKVFGGKLEPSGVKPIKPPMSDCEYPEPDKKYPIVSGGMALYKIGILLFNVVPLVALLFIS